MPVSNIDKFIRCQVKGDEIKTYLKNKHQWTNATFAKIDWTGLEQHLSSLTLNWRFSLLQLIHNWQNTGQQKELFERGKGKPILNQKLQSLKEDEIVKLLLCPFHCGEREVHLHYIECKSAKATKKRNDLVHRFQKILENYKVHEGIIRLLLWGINWYQHKDIPTICLLDGKGNDMIQQAIKEQTLIGWGKLRRGFISSRWAVAQRIIPNTSHKGNATPNWSKFFVK